MGRQSSRIIWGKTQKNPDEHDYNLARITDYDPENIYTSGNIVIAPETSYGASEEDYKAWQCVASEAAGEFSSWDESVWKELKGIKVIGKVVYVPDTEAQQIINPKRNVYKPGAKVIKLDKDGSHYIYKCIQENNIQVEGFVPSKWEVQMQRVGVAWIPRDHKDVYYNGKYHWAMWMMPEEFDDKYNEEISLYDPEMQYFRGEYCICFDDVDGSRPLKLYKYVSNYPNRGIFPPRNSALEPDESATWMEMKNVSEHVDHQELGQYPKDTKIIYEEYNQETSPVSDFVAGREYDKTRSHTCLHLIKPQGGSVSNKDYEILCATGDYTRTADPGGGYRYSPVTEYAKQIEGNYPIYGFYEIDENAPDQVIDTYFDIDHWHLKTLIKEREGYSVRIAIKEWSLETSRTDGYEVGDIVLFSVPNSDTLGVYTCIISHHADSPTYLPTEVPESYNSGTLDAKQPIDTKYWKLRKETYIDRQIHLYKSVRLTKKYELARKDWIVQTQNKHWDLESGDEVWGFIWKKYGWTKGGSPFYFPLLVTGPELTSYSGEYYSNNTRLCSFYPFMGDNILELDGPMFSSIYYRNEDEFAAGDYVDSMHATATGIFAYSNELKYTSTIMIWQGNKQWKSYDIKKYMPEDYVWRNGSQRSFYGRNTLLLGFRKYDPDKFIYDIYKLIFFDDTVYSTKLCSLDGHHGSYYNEIGPDGFIITTAGDIEEITLEFETPDGSRYEYTQTLSFSECYFTNIYGNTVMASKYASYCNVHLLPGYSKWDMDNYFSVNSRLITIPVQIEGFIWRPIDFYDIKTEFYFYSHGHKEGQQGNTSVSTQSLYASYNNKAEEIIHMSGATGDNFYVIKKRRYCYVDTSNNPTIYYIATVTQFVNGSETGVTRILNMGGFEVENTHKIIDASSHGVDIDGTDISMYDDQLISEKNPITNIYDIGEYLWSNNGLYYFADKRIYRYYDTETGELTGYQFGVSAGIWELNASAAWANLVVDVGGEESWMPYKQVLLWDTILKIPYYGNQTCTIGSIGNLKYLYIGPNIPALYEKFPTEFPELEVLIGKSGVLIDEKLWIPSLGEPSSVKCSADTGYPLQGDTDSVTWIDVTIRDPNSQYGWARCVLNIVLPNYKSLTHYKNAIVGYDPIVNGAFFWISDSVPNSTSIHPTYGDPRSNAQGFSGW